MDNDKKKKSLLILGSLTLIIALLGSAYAFFTYFKSHEAYAITSLNIKAEFIEGTNSVTFKNAYPISDSFALQNLDKLTYIDFTVTSEIESESQEVEYEIYLEEDEGNTLDSNFVKLYLTDDTNKKVTGPSIYSNLENTSYSGSSNGKVVYKDNNTGTFTKNYRLYVWLDSNYEQNEVSQTFKFKVNLYAYNAENKALSYVVKNSIEKNTDESCNPIVEEDGIIYFSGTNDCVDFNYVWYSGKLWRITAIYPDGTMKMITEDAITSIAYGEDYNFYTDESTTSWIYQWLNEDFLDTLYNYENIIVTDATWNVTSGNGTISTKLEETTMVSAKVGLLNSYEYYLSYKNTSYLSGYLNNGYDWWLSNPYNTSYSAVWSVGGNGSTGAKYELSNQGNGVRPVVNLQSTIQLAGGVGTKTAPYRIKGDKEDSIPNTTLLNTRTSGEYVNFDGELYRIVGIENGTTKINQIDCIRDDSNREIRKYFSNDCTYGGDENDDYWEYYLNNTWYNGISSNYKSMLEKGTYYLRTTSPVVIKNYKLAICQTESNTVSTKDCEKTTMTWNGYVGLPRYGEMFSSQSEFTWLITPYSNSVIWVTFYNGNTSKYTPYYDTGSVRPSVNLKSTIKITGGDGTESSPYEISL